MRFFARALTVVLFTLLASSPILAQNGDALKHARAGFDFEQKHQYQQALYEYNAAIQADPKYPYPVGRIGGMYQVLHNYPLSIQFYERAIKLDSAFDVYNYFNLGLAFRIVEKHDSAVLAMREFLRRMEPVTGADSSAMRDADFWIKFNLGCIVEKAKPRNTEPPVPLNEINSKFDDFGPSITADGQTLYFTSRRVGLNTKETIETSDYGDDLFVTRRDSLGRWSPPADMPSPLNSLDDEGAATVSADGQTLYFSLCRRPDGAGDCDIYMSELIGDQWTRPQNLGFNINSPAWDAQPSVTADGNTMYFSSRRAGSIDGSEDIYVSYRNTDRSWTKPVNLGEPINTRFNERSPFISADGKTLYFSSNGHPGFGNHDLFLSKKLPDGTWSVPINLGSPINAYGDDEFMTIPATGDRMYYSSQRSNARGDLNIYQVHLPDSLRPGPVTVFAGVVYNKVTGQPIAATLEVNDIKADQLVAVYRSNKVTGKYYLTLGTGRMYSITAKAPGYVFYSDTSVVPDTISYRELSHDLYLTPLPDSTIFAANNEQKPSGNTGVKTPSTPKVEPKSKPEPAKPQEGTKSGKTRTKPTGQTPGKKKPEEPKTPETKHNEQPGQKSGQQPGQKTGEQPGAALTLNNVFFDFRKATLRPESRTELRYLIDLLKEHPSYRIEIAGHTDSVGTAEFNMKLSRDRAEAVKDYLVKNGIAANRLVAKGYGFTKPRASNETEEGRQQNRRTEFSFIK